MLFLLRHRNKVELLNLKECCPVSQPAEARLCHYSVIQMVILWNCDIQMTIHDWPLLQANIAFLRPTAEWHRLSLHKHYIYVFVFFRLPQVSCFGNYVSIQIAATVAEFHSIFTLYTRVVVYTRRHLCSNIMTRCYSVQNSKCSHCHNPVLFHRQLNHVEAVHQQCFITR